MAKLPCPPELWSEFSTLLDQVLDLPETEQLNWVESLGEEHSDVQPWLRRVLITERAPKTNDFLSVVVKQELPTEFHAGQIIGPFVLQAPLGRGGMGEVWKAVRNDGTLDRAVALKLPHAHLLAGIQRKRFERERDILAMLSHPHIAQLYSAGVADGHPYLEMELVDGIPISRYCKENNLSVSQRLNLYRQVLEAVGYAHGRLVAHRDLKPSNILVSRDGQVKLLDFGIASMLGGETNSELTQLGGVAVTKDYAAPEQIAGKPATVAVDIYAMGVVLFEILTGRRPFRQGNVRLDEAPPPLASTNVDTAFAETVGNLPSRKLRRELFGDLDAIIAKALEHEPVNRYRTAEAFAEDLAAHLDLRPISARHISMASRSWKFILRHRVGASLAAGLVLTIILSSVGVALEAVKAERAAKRATVTKEFLISVFRASDPRVAQEKPRGTITARELLDQSATRIEKEFVDDPEIEIEILKTIGSIFMSLNERDRAYSIAQRTAEIAQQHFAPLDLIVIDALVTLSSTAFWTREDAVVEKLQADLKDRIRRANLDQSLENATWWQTESRLLYKNEASVRDGDRALDKAIELFRKYDPDGTPLIDALDMRGTRYYGGQRISDNPNLTPTDSAEHDIREAIAVADRSRAPIDYFRIDLRITLANILSLQGKIADAEASFAEAQALADQDKTAGDKETWAAAITSAHARMLHQIGERERADALYESKLQPIPDAESANGPAPFRRAMIIRYWYEYGRSLSREGKLMSAISILNKVIAAASIDNDTVSEPSVSIPRVKVVLGDTLDRAHRTDEARFNLRTAFETLSQKAPASGQIADWDREFAQERWAQFLVDHDDQPELARRLLNEVIQTTPDRISYLRALARIELAKLAFKQQDLASATELSTQAIQEMDAATKNYDIRLAIYLRGVRGDILKASGDLEAARRLSVQVRDALRQFDAPESPELLAAEARVHDST